jgi:WhiB family redox-sensing transcriptional regulator
MSFPRPNKNSDWKDKALCLNLDVVKSDKIFFPIKTPISADAWVKAKTICAKCPVKRQCLSEAVNSSPTIKEGIWGGLSPIERRNFIEIEKKK